jgi:hypothetical protein
MVARYDETLARVDLRARVIDDDPEALDDPRHPRRASSAWDSFPGAPNSDESHAEKKRKHSGRTTFCFLPS